MRFLSASFAKTDAGNSLDAGQIEPKLNIRIGVTSLKPIGQGSGLPISNLKKQPAAGREIRGGLDENFPNDLQTVRASIQRLSRFIERDFRLQALDQTGWYIRGIRKDQVYSPF